MDNSGARDEASFEGFDFAELENRFGQDCALNILRTLERFEGISGPHESKLSYEDRMRNVMLAMKDNIRFQTRH